MLLIVCSKFSPTPLTLWAWSMIQRGVVMKPDGSVHEGVCIRADCRDGVAVFRVIQGAGEKEEQGESNNYRYEMVNAQLPTHTKINQTFSTN